MCNTTTYCCFHSNASASTDAPRFLAPRPTHGPKSAVSKMYLHNHTGRAVRECVCMSALHNGATHCNSSLRWLSPGNHEASSVLPLFRFFTYGGRRFTQMRDESQ